MTIIYVAIFILILSFILAISSVKKELSVPEEIKKIRITKRKKLMGVILFLKDKIVHYSSDSS